MLLVCPLSPLPSLTFLVFSLESQSSFAYSSLLPFTTQNSHLTHVKHITSTPAHPQTRTNTHTLIHTHAYTHTHTSTHRERDFSTPSFNLATFFIRMQDNLFVHINNHMEYLFGCCLLRTKTVGWPYSSLGPVKENTSPASPSLSRFVVCCR